MSMADHSSYRSYGSNDPNAGRSGSRPADRQAAGDPLAELARLIGDEASAANSGRRGPQQEEPREQSSGPRRAPAMAGTADWRSEAAARRPRGLDEEPSESGHYEEEARDH